jgi:CHAD domain-containing protein
MASTRVGLGARSYRLSGGEDVGEGLRRIALGRAESALQTLAEIDGDDFAASIHSARKDLKKLRAVLRLARADLGKKAFRAESRRYRDAGRLLARNRDAEVKLETLAALGDRFGEELPLAASGAWSAVLRHERDRLAEAAGGETAVRIEQARTAIEDGRRRIPDWSLKAAPRGLIGAGLAGTYRQGRKEMGRALAEPSAENVHRWRKRVKDVWYQLRIVGGAWPATIGEAADQAHDLADLLGDHHDLAILRADLVDRAEVEDRPAFEALIDRRQEELLAQALALGSRFYAEKPKAFGRRIESYWRLWRAE